MDKRKAGRGFRMNEEEILKKERERTIGIVSRVINRDVEGRILKKMKRRSVQRTRLESIRDRIIFHILNPNYVGKSSSSSQN